jgi:hypothetical protein
MTLVPVGRPVGVCVPNPVPLPARDGDTRPVLHTCGRPRHNRVQEARPPMHWQRRSRDQTAAIPTDPPGDQRQPPAKFIATSGKLPGAPSGCASWSTTDGTRSSCTPSTTPASADASPDGSSTTSPPTTSSYRAAQRRHASGPCTPSRPPDTQSTPNRAAHQPTATSATPVCHDSRERLTTDTPCTTPHPSSASAGRLSLRTEHASTNTARRVRTRLATTGLFHNCIAAAEAFSDHLPVTATQATEPLHPARLAPFRLDGEQHLRERHWILEAIRQAQD